MGYVNEFKTRGKSESNSLSGRKTMTPQHISSGAGKAKAKMPTVRPIRQSGYLGQYPISANLFVANLTQILYKYGACLEAMQPTRTGIYCYRFFHRIG